MMPAPDLTDDLIEMLTCAREGNLTREEVHALVDDTFDAPWAFTPQQEKAAAAFRKFLTGNDHGLTLDGAHWDRAAIERAELLTGDEWLADLKDRVPA